MNERIKDIRDCASNILMIIEQKNTLEDSLKNEKTLYLKNVSLPTQIIIEGETREKVIEENMALCDKEIDRLVERIKDDISKLNEYMW